MNSGSLRSWNRTNWSKADWSKTYRKKIHKNPEYFLEENPPEAVEKLFPGDSCVWNFFIQA